MNPSFMCMWLRIESSAERAQREGTHPPGRAAAATQPLIGFTAAIMRQTRGNIQVYRSRWARRHLLAPGLLCRPALALCIGNTLASLGAEHARLSGPARSSPGFALDFAG